MRTGIALIAAAAFTASCGGVENEIAEVRLYVETRELAECYADVIEANFEGLHAQVVRPDGPGWSVKVTGEADLVEDFGEREFGVKCVELEE